MNILLLFFIQQNPLIQEMVNNVSADTILSHVQRLQDFIDRDSWFDSCYAAAQWIFNEFIALGIDSVYRESIPWTPHVPDNIIGIKRGILYPDSCYMVICAHFDSKNEETPDTIAPGADDNASGVAAVLESARILKDFQFDENIRFIALSDEENYMLGAGYYTYAAYERGDYIKAVYNPDMIGYTALGPAESLNVFGDTFCEPLVDHFIACADTYTNILTEKRYGAIGDGYWFKSRGWLTTEMNEGCLPEINPYKHTPADTIGMGFNDLLFCTRTIKTIIAALASSAHPNGIREMNSKKTMGNRLSIRSNPINYIGFIHYSVSGSGMVKIKLFDITGRLLKVLVKEYKQSGHYQTALDCRSLSQGSYILVMETTPETISKSFVIIR